MDSAPPPIPAATVVVLRDGLAGVEVLMLHRNPKVAFGGMWAFPGGRIEPRDGPHFDGARLAATRELAEETNVVFDPSSLVPFAHWSPPAIVQRRFDTVFFLAQAEGSEVRVDGEEIHRYEWARPGEFLGRHASGDVRLAAPTWVTLSHLADVATTAGALYEARHRPPETFVTHLVRLDDDHDVALWHGDVAYASGSLEDPGPRHRLYMQSGGWRYERTPLG